LPGGRTGKLGAMGDTFEAVVDVDVTLDEAPRLAATVVEWLAEEGVIDAIPTDEHDVWGANCYRPGPDHQRAVAHPGHPYAVYFAQSRVGRLKAVVGRTVFYPVQG
jgi:hypothetical protein